MPTSSQNFRFCWQMTEKSCIKHIHLDPSVFCRDCPLRFGEQQKSKSLSACRMIRIHYSSHTWWFSFPDNTFGSGSLRIRQKGPNLIGTRGNWYLRASGHISDLIENLGVEVGPLFCGFLSQHVIVVGCSNEYGTLIAVQSAIREVLFPSFAFSPIRLYTTTVMQCQ